MRPWSVWRRLLILLAIAFLMSAWLYCLATMHTARRAQAPHDRAEVSELMVFFRDHGAAVLAAELVGLAVCAGAMMMADRHAPRRADKSRTERMGTGNCDSEGSDTAGRRDANVEGVQHRTAATDDKSRND